MNDSKNIKVTDAEHETVALAATLVEALSFPPISSTQNKDATWRGTKRQPSEFSH
jgi:hypothetical protein